MTKRRPRTPVKIRAAFKADLAAILMAEDWPAETLPARFLVKEWAHGKYGITGWTAVIKAARPTSVVNDRGFLELHSWEKSPTEARVSRRFRAWIKAAQEAGIRRMDITHRAEPSGHQRVAAEIAASKWDPQ